MINQTLANRYRVQELVGQGGMADVYRARDMLLERDVAIKILRGDLANDAVALLRFKHEAVAVSKLSHPNIIEIYDVGEEAGRQYIVMEFIDGPTLKELIKRRGGVYKEEAVDIMKQLTSAVAEAHHNDIIHRDIKPQNILVKNDGTVIITDFGIALAQNALQLTQADSVMGSVHYLAPELARGEKASYQSDIYALGIVFYELLAGTVPFQGESAVNIAMLHIKDEMPSIREFNPSIPQSIENVIFKATFKNKHQRYLHADDMLQDLKTVFSKKRVDEDVIGLEDDFHDETKILPSIADVDEEEPQTPRKRKWWIAILILLLSGALYLGYTFFLKEEEDPLLMPDLSNMTLEEARKELDDLGLVVGKIQRELDDKVEADHIIYYEPIKDSVVKEGDSVNFTVSKGTWFVVEDYSGQDLTSIRSELESSSKIRVHVEYVSSQDVSPGIIISQSMLNPGDKVDPNITKDIKFMVSKPIEIAMPDLIGKTLEQAKAELDPLEVSYEFIQMETENMTEEEEEALVRDEVVRTDPIRGSIYSQQNGRTIKIYHY